MKIATYYKIFLLLILSGCSQSTDLPVINGSVATAHPLATKAGMDVLVEGGNAFDAAVAVAATLNVVESTMSGLGGYGTILLYDVDSKKVQYLNPSGRFPANTNTDLMRAPTPGYMENRVGPKSISTPGNLNAWAAMHNKFGGLPWEDLFSYAIKHAENGYQLSSIAAADIEKAYNSFPEYSRKIYGKNDAPLKEGDLLIQSDLAKTYKIIAKEGVKPFYHGAIAEKIDLQLRKVESFLTIEDLQNNIAEWGDPIKINYRGYDVYTAGPPANSFAAFVNIGLMANFKPNELQHNSAQYLHLFAEMAKQSYIARLAYSFDPEIRQVPLDSILASEYLLAVANNLDKEKASVFKPPHAPESMNTTHFVIVDKWGNVVSATQTLGNLFGSRVMVEGSGFWLNNSMAYATFEPKGNPMDAFPGRHKLSGDCPVIILKDEQPWAALGSPGGHTITQNVPQIIFNLIDFKMSMQSAIDEPKISFAEPNRILIESVISTEIADNLRARGHQLYTRKIGNATGIKIIYDNQGNISHLDVGIDSRREGRLKIYDE